MKKPVTHIVPSLLPHCSRRKGRICLMSDKVFWGTYNKVINIFPSREYLIITGGSPSPYDRANAAVLMGHCMALINEGFAKQYNPSSIVSGVVGFQKGQIVFIPMEELKNLMHPSFR